MLFLMNCWNELFKEKEEPPYDFKELQNCVQLTDQAILKMYNMLTALDASVVWFQRDPEKFKVENKNLIFVTLEFWANQREFLSAQKQAGTRKLPTTSQSIILILLWRCIFELS